MAQVTSGVVEYSRVRKDDDYGIKREAKVSLSFTVDEGEDHLTVLALLGANAVERVHGMIQIRVPEGVVSSGASVAPSAVAPATPSGPKEAAAAALNAAETKPETPTKPKRPPKTQQPATPAADAILGAETPAPATPAPAASDDGLGDLLGAVEVKPVTDQELGAFITRRNAVLKKPEAIRALIAKYAGPVPKQARDIPQEKRQDFLKELDALT